MISLVTPESLEPVWGALRPRILEALDVGGGIHYTEEFYYQSVKNGAMQMWIYHIENDIIAGGVLSVNEYPKGKVLFIELLAGRRLNEWLDQVEPLLKEYASQIGATTIEASCRPGLVKKLTRWQSVATLMRLE